MKLDHNVRLYFDLDQVGQSTNLFSFHAEYMDYLDENNFYDVSQINLDQIKSVLIFKFQ